MNRVTVFGFKAHCVLILAAALGVGTVALADETQMKNRCESTTSDGECTFLGTVEESVLLVGTFESCTQAGLSRVDPTHEDTENSVVYLFDLSESSNVALDVAGLGGVTLFRDDEVNFRADEHVTSANLRLEAGHFTLVGRAPTCVTAMNEWKGVYKIRIDTGRDASVGTDSVPKSQQVVSPTIDANETKKFSVGRWAMVGLLSNGIFWLIFLIAGLTA